MMIISCGGECLVVNEDIWDRLLARDFIDAQGEITDADLWEFAKVITGQE